MALPMNTMPTFTLTVPSSGKSVKYRPFLVKEEKALLIAQQSEDASVMVDTLKGVIKSCVIDNIDVDSLAVFDLEYIFTQIRGKSVGEIVELLFACDVDHGEQNEKAKSKIKIDLSTIQVTRNPDHTNKIMLFGDVGVVMKYPNVNVIKQLESGGDDVSEIFDVIVSSIECIFQGDDIYYAHEQTREELNQFLNNLTSEQFTRIQKFFETMPKLTTTIEYTCPICGREHKRVLEGLQSFFS